MTPTTISNMKRRIQREVADLEYYEKEYAKSRSPRLRALRRRVADNSKERIEELCKELARMIVP